MELRDPIDPVVVAAGLRDPGRWTLRHVAVTGSTNADLAADASAAAGTVLIAEEQLAGRGRLGRSWLAPAGSSLMISVLLRPGPVPAGRRGWAGALLGLALVDAIRQCTGLGAGLKWPNDVLIADRKCAGILAEAAGDAVVVGTGVNVTPSVDELPVVPGGTPPTSLSLSGAPAGTEDRAALAAALLNSFGDLLDRWYAAAGDLEAAGLLADYRLRCGTIGSRVRVELPTGERVIGTAVDVAADGRLLVQPTSGRRREFSAADVVHLRPAAGPAPPATRRAPSGIVPEPSAVGVDNRG